MTRRVTIQGSRKGGGDFAPSPRARYRDAAMNWIALGVLLSAWHMEARLDRGHPLAQNARHAVTKSSHAREDEPLWWAESRARSWIGHAAAAATATSMQLAAPPVPVHAPLTTVRMIRRWLPHL